MIRDSLCQGVTRAGPLDSYAHETTPGGDSVRERPPHVTRGFGLCGLGGTGDQAQ